MDDARLRTGLWVKAQIRLCDIESIPAVVVHRGDVDASAVLLKINRLADGCVVLTVPSPRVDTVDTSPSGVLADHDPSGSN